MATSSKAHVWALVLVAEVNQVEYSIVSRVGVVVTSVSDDSTASGSAKLKQGKYE